MSILILPLKIISIPLIIIIGDLNLNEKTKTILLLVFAFLCNNLLGYTARFASFFIPILEGTYLFFLSIIIIGFIILTYLVTINMYIKRKIDINNILFTILIAIAFFTGLFLI